MTGEEALKIIAATPNAAELGLLALRDNFLRARDAVVAGAEGIAAEAERKALAAREAAHVAGLERVRAREQAASTLRLRVTEVQLAQQALDATAHDCEKATALGEPAQQAAGAKRQAALDVLVAAREAEEAARATLAALP